MLTIKLTGTTFAGRQVILEQLQNICPIKAYLVQDKENQHSDNAVAVYVDTDFGRVQVGWVPEVDRKTGRQMAKIIYDKIEEGTNFRCALTVIGGKEDKNYGAMIELIETGGQNE